MFGPEVVVGAGIDQLSGHANPPRVLHAAFDNVRYAQSLRDLAQVAPGAAFVIHHARAG